MNLFRLESSGLFDRNMPRYTSYPTATHFSNAMHADIMSDWLTALDPATSVSLYYQILSVLMLVLRVSDTRSRWRQSAATLTIGAPTRDASRRSISAGGGSSRSYSFELRYFDTSSSSAAWVAIYHDWWLGLFRERTWVFCWCRLRWHRRSSDNIVDSSRWILRFGCVLTFRLVWQPLHRSSESVFTDKLWVCQWCSEAFP